MWTRLPVQAPGGFDEMSESAALVRHRLGSYVGYPKDDSNFPYIEHLSRESALTGA